MLVFRGLVGDLFTDSAMVNHHFEKHHLGEYVLELFPGIEQANPS